MTMAEPLPLVLVPGLNCTARLYAEQIPALWPYGSVTIADHRRDDTVAAIAHRILTAAPPVFALVGLSMGGYIAFAMMRQAPERIARLALLDTSARPDTPEQSEQRRRLIDIARRGRFSEIPDIQFPRFVHRRRHGDETLKRLVRTMAEETGAEAFIRQQKAIMSRPDSEPDLKTITCPTLVLVGEGDELIPPELSKEIAAGIHGAHLVVVPDCGHLSTLEQPQAVNTALVEWMTR
jgi:pimeloyl-ACP methyl ester carboxylesterase